MLLKMRITGLFEKLQYDRIFIIDTESEKEYTYSEFFSCAVKLADYINNKIKGNSFIAIKENSFDLALLYFSTMFTNKRIMVMDPQKGNKEIDAILRGIEPTGIFLDDQAILTLNNHFVLKFPDIKGSNDHAQIKREVIDRIGVRDFDVPFLVTYTSGTSGLTKGVEHSLRSLFLTAISMDEAVGARNGCFYHVMPMTYMAGILNSLIYPFINGSRIIIGNRFSIVTASSFWDTVIKYKADQFWLSPTMLMMIDRLDRSNRGESYCREVTPTFLIGTAPLSQQTRIKFESRYGVKVYASYGLTETLFISVETPDSVAKSDEGSVGELLNGVKYRISDDGELHINVPWMLLRYTNEDTKEYFDKEFYKTGDIAEMRDGCLYITGRIKDLIIKGGMNLSPALIEKVTNEIPDIIESVAVGVRDKNGEEKVCCGYVSQISTDLIPDLENRIKNRVKEELGKNYSIDYLWNIKDLPRNINGKIDRNAIVRSWESNYNDR